MHIFDWGNMSNNYQILISKLDKFIKKYYLNKLLRGIILSSLLILTYSLFVIFLEFFGNFSVIVRSVIFYSVITFLAITFIYLILIPLLKLNKVGKTINYKSASYIITRHFNDIQDKLLNVLELYDMPQNNNYSKELILASIDSKIDNIKLVPFNLAINKKENIKYLKYLFALITLSVLTYVFYPRIFQESTERIINFSVEYKEKAPFEFIIINDGLTCKKGDDFVLKVITEGTSKPKDIFINFSNNNFILSETKNNQFEYLFKNVNSNIKFKLSSSGFNSDIYEIAVLPTPVINKFQITVTPPAYTGEEQRLIENTGDITIPEGTKIKWNIIADQTSEMYIKINDTVILNHNEKNKENYSFEKNFKNSSDYELIISNDYFKENVALKYYIKVIPDLFPSIKVISMQDSIKKNIHYFKGFINDDYGFSNLNFVTVSSKTNKKTEYKILINERINSQEFYYTFDFNSITDSKGDNLEYYFEVADNDKINGSKVSKSQKFEFKIDSEKELEKKKDEATKSTQTKLSESKKLAESLQKKVSELKKDLMNKNLSDWEKSKKLEDIIKTQESLEKKIFDLQMENQMSNEINSQLTEEQSEIIEKQKQIEELLNELMDEDLKKMLEELKELMNQMDPKKLNELSEKMEMSYEDLSKQLERDLELLKKMEIDQKLNKTIDKLDELAKEQEKLSENHSDENKENAEKQDSLNKEIKNIEKEYNDLKEKNSQLQSPEKLQDFNQEFDDLNQEMNQAKDNLNKGNNNKAQKNQKSSAQKMKNLSDKMKEMQKNNMSMKNQQNMEDLRQIIDNILTFSFSQEDLLQLMQNISYKDPRIDKIKRDQNKLIDDFYLIKDSLYALAKRTPMLSNVINKEIISIEQNFKKIQSDYDENRIYNVKVSQQFVMTSANNLALLLSEILKQMQQQMQQQQMSGESQCQNPKNGNPMPGMQKQQQSLKQQMEQMIEQLKKGQGEGKQFDKNSLNKQIGKMMAEQEKFSKMLNELRSKSTLSPDAQKKLNEISSLNEQNLRDLINKNISPQLLKRQELILTRLLEAEKSEQEREIDKKRESNEAKNEDFRNPEEIFKYKRINSNYNELLNNSNIEMNKYYMDKYKQYILNLNKDENGN